MEKKKFKKRCAYKKFGRSVKVKMPDMEKYIEILSKTVKTVKESNKAAPIQISLECIEDILELLKEQEHKDRMFHALEDDWKRLKALLKEQEKALYELGQLLKERAEEIERLKMPTAGDNHIPLRWRT